MSDKYFSLEQWQADFVNSSFELGMRVAKLESQPAPWLKRGLEILEAGGLLDADKIKSINLSGGTDHPDPWFG
jgi:hypothetical protein